MEIGCFTRVSGTSDSNRPAAQLVKGSDVVATENSPIGKVEDFGAATTKTSDVLTKVAEPQHPKEIIPTLKLSGHSGLDQGLLDFLARPEIVSTGSFLNTDDDTFFTPVPLFKTALTTMRMKKLAGFYSMRATLVFTLQLNATRFQQGRYILGYVSTGGSDTYLEMRNLNWVTMHTYSLVQKTQIPHVEIDLATDTEVEIKIPFSSSYTALTINEAVNGKYDTGFLVMYPYSALDAAAGNLSAPWTMYCRFEDVELGGLIIPQSGRVVVKRTQRGTPPEVEQAAAGEGPIASILSKVSKVASIAGEIPLLSPVATTVSWVSDIASRVASVFGWSKPIALGPVTRTSRSLFHQIATADGVDLSQPLSAVSSNEVGVLPGFGGIDIDEMSMDYIKTIPSWFKTVNWATNQVPGTALVNMSTNPLSFLVTEVVGGKTIEHYAPFLFLTKLFTYWRGGIAITLKFVKTEFHSGRLSISFRPEEPWGVGASTTLANSVYLHRQIIDLRTSNEFMFVIPYVSIRPMLVSGGSLGMGVLNIHVLDQLNAPDTVASSISMLMEVSAAPDFELAVPRTIDRSPTVIVPQADLNEDALNSVIAYGLGRSKVSPSSTDIAENCVGEKIISLRSLLKRNCYIYELSEGEAGSSEWIYPFAVNANYLGAQFVVADTFPDYYSLFGMIYAYSRGGVRIKGISTAGGSQWYYAAYSIRPEAMGLSTMITHDNALFQSESMRGPNFAFSRADLSGGIEVQAPMYHQYHVRPNAISVLHSSLADMPSSYTSTANRGMIELNRPEADPAMYVFRSGADDCNFGGFISIPPFTADT